MNGKREHASMAGAGSLFVVCPAAYILFCRDVELACDEKVVKKLNATGKSPIPKRCFPVGCSGKWYWYAPWLSAK